MAVSRKKPSERAAKAEKEVKAEKKEVKSQADLKVQEQHDQALAWFHPSVKDWFKEKLGIDLKSMDTAFLFDLRQGKVTKPVEIVVEPLAYDRESKANVVMPKIKTYSSICVNLPIRNGKSVAPDGDKNRIFFRNVPCRPMLEKDFTPVGGAVRSDAGQERELPSFTDDQLLALEGIGIDRSRMFGGFNHLSREQKFDIVDGNVFFVDGNVKTDFGVVNVIGQGQLGKDHDGKAVAQFETTYPEERSADKVIDIIEGRRIGVLELDFFRRNNDGRIITNVNGAPILNDAGYNLVNFGNAMEPVRGYKHSRQFKDGKFSDQIEAHWYQVSVVNGNLYATQMTEQKVKGLDGKETIEPQVPNVRMKDGQVFVNGSNKPMEFATEADMKNYMSGRLAVVKNATFVDYSGEKKKSITYDAVVYADNSKANFGKQRSPQTTKKILDLMERRSRKTGPAKRQNFSVGIG